MTEPLTREMVEKIETSKTHSSFSRLVLLHHLRLRSY